MDDVVADSRHPSILDTGRALPEAVQAGQSEHKIQAIQQIPTRLQGTAFLIDQTHLIYHSFITLGMKDLRESSTVLLNQHDASTSLAI